MATERGNIVNSPFSQKWVYGDWGTPRYDAGADSFVIPVSMFSQYQHQYGGYTGRYGQHSSSTSYKVSNATSSGGDTWARSTPVQDVACLGQWQWSGLIWPCTVNVAIPRNTTSKVCNIGSSGDVWASDKVYGFWQCTASGNITTPVFSWAAPTADVSVDISTIGKARVDVSNRKYAQGAVPAGFGSESSSLMRDKEVIYDVPIGKDFEIRPYHNYSYTYRLKDNHNTYSESYRYDFTAPGKPPVITSARAIDITKEGAVIEFSVDYELGDSFGSWEIQYGLSTNYGTTKTGTSSTIPLTGLDDNTMYYYKITITGEQGDTGEYEGSFKTLRKTVLNPTIKVDERYVSSIDAIVSVEDASLVTKITVKAHKGNVEWTPPDVEAVITSGISRHTSISIEGLEANTVYRLTVEFEVEGKRWEEGAFTIVKTLNQDYPAGTVNKDTAHLFTNFSISNDNKKTLIEKDQVVVINGKIRYIDVIQSSPSSLKSYLAELQVYNREGENIATGKEVDILKGHWIGGREPSVFTDGNIRHFFEVFPDPEAEDGDTETIVRVDLGEEYTDISHITLWRDYAHNPIYPETRIYGRDEKKQLTWKFQSYRINGTYKETESGYTAFVKGASK